MKTVYSTRGGHLRLAVGDAGEWFAETSNRIVELVDSHDFQILLPLLEEEPRTTMNTLRAASQAHGTTEFPLESLLAFTFGHSSAYWKTLALAWTETLDVANEEILQKLEAIADKASGWPQRLRHQAAHFLRGRRN